MLKPPIHDVKALAPPTILDTPDEDEALKAELVEAGTRLPIARLPTSPAQRPRPGHCSRSPRVYELGHRCVLDMYVCIRTRTWYCICMYDHVRMRCGFHELGKKQGEGI